MSTANLFGCVQVQLQQSSDEWLLWRRCHITATDSAKIAGVSPWSTPYDCYLEKIDGKRAVMNPAMQRGIDLEPEARDFLIQKHGRNLTPKVFEMVDIPYFGASLDAITDDNSSGTEIKAPGKKTMEKAFRGEVAEVYKWQCQKQMLVMGWERMSIFYYQDEFTNIEHFIERDEAMIREIISKETNFFNNYILTMTPPPLSPRDFKTFDGETINNLALSWIELKDFERENSVLLKGIEARIEEITGKVNCTFPKTGLKKSIVNRKGSIDWETLCEEHLIFEEDKEKHRKKGSSYSKFTIEKD